MITLAIPSKGRLKEQALEVLAKAGLAVSLPGDERKYHARVEGLDDVEVVFLSASEISGEIGQGAVDLGITGEDLVRENLADWESRAEIVARLGFGNADVVVAVPD
ncbi:MAG: ATP phosphoribosyltransferase, partial [Mesorhizobium sp.]